MFILSLRVGFETPESGHDHLDDNVGVEDYDDTEVEGEVDEGSDIGAFIITCHIVTGIGAACPTEVSGPLKGNIFLICLLILCPTPIMSGRRIRAETIHVLRHTR